jgi:hypothetical protein
MQRLWPQFCHKKEPNGLLIWRGILRPKAQPYDVIVFWKPDLIDRPYVLIADPSIKPRPGGTYKEIPHLMFDEEHPESSGLCLFDPEGREWSEANLIAETTMYWASEWLVYYELWHMDGRWLGPSAGYENIAEVEAAQAAAIREAVANVH